MVETRLSWTAWMKRLAAPALLGLFVLAMFGDLLFFPGDRLVSALGTDISRQFFGLRTFCFDSWRNGDFPFWNPNEYGGVPALGSFQSALLYPPNLIHLFLPVNVAINWVVALHVWMAGVFFYAWMRVRELGKAPSLFGAILFMFCAPLFSHVYAGHLSNICAMAWVPLVFACLEQWSARGSRMALCGGAVAVAMQILAGHPQYVFFTFVACAIYCILLLFRDRKWRIAWGAAVMYGAGALLAAVQLLPGFEASGESVRNSGVNRHFAAMFSLPPENLLTMLAPGFFGEMSPSLYWGRCYLWEMSLFLGIAGLVLACCGVLWGRRRFALTAAAAAACLALLALGSHTPLFDFLYRFVPGFSMFRGWSKFALFAAAFVIALAAEGSEVLMRERPRRIAWLAGSFGICAVLLLALAAWALSGSAAGDWAGMIRKVQETRESYLPAAMALADSFVASGMKVSGLALLIGGISALVCAGLLLLRVRWVHAVYALMLFGCIEVAVYAGRSRASFPTGPAADPEVRRVISNMPQEMRMLNLANLDFRLRLPAREIWGSDPGVLKRYAEFVSFTQGMDPDRVGQYVLFRARHPWLAMIRCGRVLLSDDSGVIVREFNDALPRFLLVGRVEVCANRNGIFTRMVQPGFDPRKTVILEREPPIAATGTDSAGSVRTSSVSSDGVTLDVEASAPCVLLVTDPFCKGWKATGLPGSAAKSYEIMPADYALMGIPLQAGKHRIRLEYKPRTFTAGAWVSCLAWLGLGWFCFRRRDMLHRASQVTREQRQAS